MLPPLCLLRQLFLLPSTMPARSDVMSGGDHKQIFTTQKKTPEKLASYNSQMQVSKGATKGVYILTSVTKKAWNPYGTLLGSSTTATGSADIVFASITFTSDFLHPRKHIHLLLNREIRSKRHMLQVFHE